ncbi:MAG: hypothetical protein JW768_10480 [Chitinispirillaceae bacterium]|nr:hypothetical protein [Chitinispirillaceae bacterium]
MKPKATLVIMLLAGVIIAGTIINGGSQLVSFASVQSLLTTPAAPKKSDASDWKKIDSLVKAGLTKSALKEVEALYARSKKSGATTQFIKALMYRMRLDSRREEQSLVKSLRRLERETAEAKGPLKAILHSITAEIYWRYYQENRWRFFSRTQTDSFKQDDITTWDLSAIVSATIDHYDKSLADKDLLKKTKLDGYSDILFQGKESGKRRPTLLDFLAHRAIDMYMNSEADLPQPFYVFQLDKKEYFASLPAFSTIKLSTKDTLSFKFRALQLLQELVVFHKGDADPEALFDTDLKRLDFVWRYSTLENRDSLYLQSLEGLEQRCGTSPIATEVMHETAQWYARKGREYKAGTNENSRWFCKKAVEICSQAMKKHPKSYGACLCKVLKQELSAKSISLEAEEVVLPEAPFRALLGWKNIGRVWFRLIPMDRDVYNKLKEQHGYHEQEKLIQYLREKKPVAAWNTQVPDEGDFQYHSAEVKIPKCSYGFYVLCASSNADFSYPKNGIAVCHFWVSRIAYFCRANKNTYEFYLRDRETGLPIAQAKVKKLERVYDQAKRQYSIQSKSAVTSDKEGKVVFPSPYKKKVRYSHPFRLEVVSGKDRLVSEREYFHYHHSGKVSKRTQTFFFTDRSVYRPGQTVYFKAIVLKRIGDSCVIVPRHKTTVEFRDVNFKKVSDLSLVTNEYGTMSGQFVAPLGVLNGQMSIREKGGSVFFNVEEYKRPKFEITTDPIKSAYRLGQKITLRGKAQAYAGSAVDGAQVSFRVVRSTAYPFRFGWWDLWCPPSPEMEIISGSTKTNDTGGFAVTFTAIPDRSVAKRYKPVFIYTTHFDITDINGETRSMQTPVSVGYDALLLSLAIGDQIEKDRDSVFVIQATNLSGISQPAKGTIRISRLAAPSIPLRERLWQKPDKYIIKKEEYLRLFPGLPYADEERVDVWPKQKEMLRKAFDTKKDTTVVIAGMKGWPQGVYSVETQAKDTFGKKVVTTQYFTLFSRTETTPPAPLCDWFSVLKNEGEPGEKAAFLIGSGEKNVKILFEVEQGKEIVQQKWLTISAGQKVFEVPIKEKHRGNFSVHFTFIRNGRCYRHDELITVPWTNKELSFSFETFRSTLEPGQKERWKIKISGAKKDKIAAEMATAMYDASLDAFRPHSWSFNILPSGGSGLTWDATGQFGQASADIYTSQWNPSASCPALSYPYLNWFGFSPVYYGGYGIGGGMGMMRKSPYALADEPEMLFSSPAMPAPTASPTSRTDSDGAGDKRESTRPEQKKAHDGRAARVDDERAALPAGVDGLDAIKARANLNETAFFFPQLMTDKNGDIIVSFTMPEALTRWKMLGFAHTKDLQYGLVTKEVVTQKQFMVVPNLPRFLRENDSISISAKVTNLSDKELAGSAQLMLFDAATMRPVDSAMANRTPQQTITVKEKRSTQVGWNIAVPEGLGAVTVRIVAKAGGFTDGEETTLPVLTNRMLVTEILPLDVRGKGTKKFAFEKFIAQEKMSSTLRSHRLTLEFTQNPVWYAIQALPYLMEFPHDCSEQIFARLYANTIASSIANAHPRIKAVFETWKSLTPGALLSNLKKNRELKSALLEETPWVLDGTDESERKQRVALLFDLNKMSNEFDEASHKLEKLQMTNGGWPWFAGMPDDRYITQYIVTGFGRLMHLGMIDKEKHHELMKMINLAVRYTDDRINQDYDGIMKRKTHRDSNHLGALQIQYLYARSFFKGMEVAADNKKAVAYFKGQAKRYWLRNNRYLQCMIALALNRMGDDKVPAAIIRSLKENALKSDEMGMYWKEMYEGYHWYEAAIESQALFIEAFDEVAHDDSSVEAMKVWLLKSKQTQNWKTTRATAEACYALLLRGSQTLAKRSDVLVKLGPVIVDPNKLRDVRAEAGTGYFKTSWSGGDIVPSMGKVTVEKRGKGVAWGAVYWQYFEQLDNITPASTPLKLSKKLFVKHTGDRGPVLKPHTGRSSLRVGDKITVRIEVRVDRDLEYVHMKDMRAAGFEPKAVLSGYQWQDGLGYYESTRDCATHFFFSRLGKGTYVFEYDVVVSHKGDFSNGITSIQCLYAPEFACHSEGIRVRVGE